MDPHLSPPRPTPHTAPIEAEKENTRLEDTGSDHGRVSLPTQVFLLIISLPLPPLPSLLLIERQAAHAWESNRPGPY